VFKNADALAVPQQALVEIVDATSISWKQGLQEGMSSIG